MLSYFGKMGVQKYQILDIYKYIIFIPINKE